MKAGLLLLVISSMLAVTGKALAGQIIDPSALAQIQSYCVDTQNLSGFDRNLVKDFLKAQGKRKHLLTKLRWKLVPDCREGASDAVIKVEFVRVWMNRAGVGSPILTPGQDLERPYDIEVKLKVVDARSQETVYRVQAGAVEYAAGPGDSASHVPSSDNTNPVLERQDALYHAFGSLVGDVRHLRQMQK